MLKNTLVRADSSTEIGTGHIMRDLALVEELIQTNITFATQELEGNINSKIVGAGYPIKTLKDNSANALIELIKELNIDTLIIDHYGINELFEKKIKDKSSATLIVVDDTYEKHYCDILINPNIYAKREPYIKKVLNSTMLLTGPEFSMLRSEFRKSPVHKLNQSNKPPFRLLLTMGGSDSKNITTKVIEAIGMLPHYLIELTVILGAANPHKDGIKSVLKGLSCKYTTHINPPNMAELMLHSDATITAAGGVTLELLSLNVPFFYIQIADNQHLIASFLHENSYAHYLGEASSIKPASMASTIEKNLTLNRLNELKSTTAHFKKIVGSGSIANKIGSLKYRNFSLRPIDKNDSQLLFALANEAEVRKASLNSNPISLSEHKEWLEKELESKTSYLYAVVDSKNEFMGSVRFQQSSEHASPYATISISLLPSARGHGVSTLLLNSSLAHLFKESHYRHVVAVVKKSNPISKRSFNQAGFTLLDESDDIYKLTISKEEHEAKNS